MGENITYPFCREVKDFDFSIGRKLSIEEIKALQDGGKVYVKSIFPHDYDFVGVKEKSHITEPSGSQWALAADFIPCVAFDRAGEFAEKYFHQGTKIIVTGRIQTGSYTNRENQKVYTTDVIVEEQEFTESKGAAGERESQGAAGKDIGQGFMTIPDGMDDEGLPFT